MAKQDYKFYEGLKEKEYDVRAYEKGIEVKEKRIDYFDSSIR